MIAVGLLLGPSLAALGLGVAVGSPLLAVAGPLVVALGEAERRRRWRWRRSLGRAESLPAAIDQMVQQLQSGASLTQACLSLDRRVGPDGGGADGRGPLGPLIVALDRGATFRQAVEALERSGSTFDPSIRLVATTLILLSGNGGPALPALRRLRHVLVGRAHRRRRAAAQASSAVASAATIALAPALFGLLLAGVEPDLAHFYLREPLGAVCAVGSVLLSASGWFWIQATVTRSVGAEL